MYSINIQIEKFEIHLLKFCKFLLFAEDQRLKRQRELEANDFYDSDEDTYLDRTGTGKYCIYVVNIH